MRNGRRISLSRMAGPLLALLFGGAGQQACAGALLIGAAEVSPPHGFVAMCRTDPSFCGAAAGAEGAAFDTGAIGVGLRAEVQDAGAGRGELLLHRINLLVNRKVRQVADMDQFGVDEVWRRPGLGRDAAGDCEDIAIEKRHLLIAAGFDPAALRFAVVYSEKIGAHVVLVATTTAGDMVLDSLTPLLRRWDRTGYLWVSVQSAADPGRWTLVVREPSGPAATIAG